MDTQVPSGRLLARWTRAQVLGHLMLVGGPLLFFIAGVTFGLDLDDAGFIVIPIAVNGIAAFLTWRFGTWAKIVGVVLALATGFMFFWAVFGLFAPNSFFEFMFGLLMVPGMLLAIIAGISATVAKSRGHMTERATAGEAKTMKVVLVALGLLAVLSGILTIVSRDSADARNTATTVGMKDFKFVPKNITVAGGSTIFVKNEDPFSHTFTIDALGIDETLTIGSSARIQLPSKPGSYFLYCTPHSDSDPTKVDEEDMSATLVIT